jgi:hypothetical protein
MTNGSVGFELAGLMRAFAIVSVNEEGQRKEVPKYHIVRLLVVLLIVQSTMGPTMFDGFEEENVHLGATPVSLMEEGICTTSTD